MSTIQRNLRQRRLSKCWKNRKALPQQLKGLALQTSQAKVCEVHVYEVVSVLISNCSNESRAGSLI